MNALHEITKFIKSQNQLDTLRFITCGSVDDGKSTLLGRILYEAQLIFDDQVDSLIKDSKKIGTQGGDIDFALLVDGLAAEREQGITIDVAYRFFSTDGRKFIVADSPGHEQFTRNMVTAASNAELAIILVDARKGVLKQTKRHSFIADMVGIKNIIVAVNKMDLVNFDEQIFEDIKADFNSSISENLNFEQIQFIPISALKGDNIVTRSENMKWSSCQPLLSMLENLEIQTNRTENFSMPVQMVLRPNLDFRGFCGKVSSGSLTCGEEIVVADSGEKAQVSNILIGDAKTENCKYKDAVTLVLDKEIDISRGQTVYKKQSEINFGKLFNANVIWFDQSSGSKNRPYLLKIGSKKVNAKILKVKSMIDINSYERRPESSIQMNDIFECEISLDDQTAFASYKDVPDLGSFILIDKVSNLTVGGGVINHSLRRDENIRWQDSDVTIKQRNLLLGSEAKVLWLTGLSGSGKSTIANLVEKKLHAEGVLTYILDGDNLRHGLNVDLGFTKNDRIENLRRSGEVSKILHDAGVTVIASFISPYSKDREQIKALFKEGDFFEVYVKADIETIKQRDPKGLYKKALNDEIPNFTGINDAYEEPNNPNLIIDTTKLSPEEAVNQICLMIGLD